MTILAIDPGVSGAIALIDDHGEFLEVEDIPLMVKSKAGKNKVNGAATMNLIGDWRENYGPIKIAAIESVHSMPGQGVSSSFSFGHSLGVVEGVIAGAMIRSEMVTPQKWKKHFSLNSDKEVCRAKAIHLYPEAPLSRKKDAGRAEALLIARYIFECCQ